MREDCDTCRHFGADFDHLPCSVCSGCSRWEAPTNADHIRSMTDEELAALLARETFRIAKPCFDAFGYGLEEQVIYVKRLDWLKQPYKDGD